MLPLSALGTTGARLVTKKNISVSTERVYKMPKKIIITESKSQCGKLKRKYIYGTNKTLNAAFAGALKALRSVYEKGFAKG